LNEVWFLDARFPVGNGIPIHAKLTGGGVLAQAEVDPQFLDEEFAAEGSLCINCLAVKTQESY
jgi:hypothetical protein